MLVKNLVLKDTTDISLSMSKDDSIVELFLAASLVSLDLTL